MAPTSHYICGLLIKFVLWHSLEHFRKKCSWTKSATLVRRLHYSNYHHIIRVAYGSSYFLIYDKWWWFSHDKNTKYVCCRIQLMISVKTADTGRVKTASREKGSTRLLGKTNTHIYTLWYMYLTHWGRVTHICVSNLTIIGADNGLSPCQRQAIIWTNAGILLIGLS